MDKKLFALLSGCLLSGIAEAGQTKPNVIIIYTDDHGTLDANCFGAPDLCTPNIDALATYGVRFTQFYAAPVSSASRACLLTGQYAKRTGLTGNAGWTGLRPEKETIAERMKANGYQTACIGSGIWVHGKNIDLRHKDSIISGGSWVDVLIVTHISFIGVVRICTICGEMMKKSMIPANSSLPKR